MVHFVIMISILLSDAFVKRVGKDAQRLMRFMSYVEKRKKQVMDGSIKKK